MKAYRFLNGSNFRQMTEEQVSAAIDHLPPKSHVRSEAAAIFDLAIGESVTLESGAEFTRIEDDSPSFATLICNRGGRAKKCQFCSRLVQDGDGLLCDGPPTTTSKKKTCDAFMCRACGKHVGPNRDLCPRCVSTAAERRQA